MEAQFSPNTWDDEIDLREYVVVLLRWKWAIAGFVAASVAIAAVVSYAVLPPAYESSATFMAPVADGAQADDSQELGMSPEVYSAFAESDRVLRGVLERTNLPLTLRELRDEIIEVNLEPATGLLHVTALAATPENAYRILEAWHGSFDRQAFLFANEQLTRRLQIAEATLDSLREAMAGVGLDVPPTNPRLVQTKVERDRLIGIQAQLPQRTQARPFIAPTVPEAPVSPNGALSMVIAGVLAACVGVFSAFVREWWTSSAAYDAGRVPE